MNFLGTSFFQLISQDIYYGSMPVKFQASGSGVTGLLKKISPVDADTDICIVSDHLTPKSGYFDSSGGH